MSKKSIKNDLMCLACMKLIDDKRFMIYYLNQYLQKGKSFNVGNVSRFLGLEKENDWYKLGLCTCPEDGDQFKERITHIALYTGADRFRLMEIIEAVRKKLPF